MTRFFFLKKMILLLAFSATSSLSAAEFIKGYTRFANSQLLEVNNPGAGGTVLFVDEAATGGADLVSNGGNPVWGWEVPSDGSWAIGDDVTFTGIALPVWANDPDSDGQSNTQNAVWRLRFYSTGPDSDWQGSNNLSTSDDSFIGSVDVNFSLADNGVGVYRAVFDTPLVWDSADSTTIWWYLQAVGGKAFRLKTGSVGAASVRENRTSGAAFNDSLRMSLAGTVDPLIDPAPPLEWSPARGGGNRVSLYSENNWIEPDTFAVAAAGSVDPNVVLDRSLIIRTGTPGGPSGANGTLFLGSGQLVVSHATLRMNATYGINMGSSFPQMTITDGRVLTQSITDGDVVMQGRSELTLYGPNPLVRTTIDLQSSDCFVYFLDRLPSNVDAGYLANFTVGGAPAVEGSNIIIKSYYQGAVLRPVLPGNVALKAFDSSGLTGAQWNFTPGFKGSVGLGFATHDAGLYSIDGWGSDIWGTSDQCHFAYRSLIGDGEIIARVDFVEDTHVWAKSGVMIRESLDADSANAFLCQRPDNQITFQSRAATGGTSVSLGAIGGTNSVKWLKLERAGDLFTASYSIDGTNYTVAGTNTIAMVDPVFIGLAASSHIGVERCASRIREVSIPGVSTNGPLGIFTADTEIDRVWAQDNQIRSFLLKKGYMVVVAEDGGGQGKSRFYAATERDLKVDLADDGLDNRVSYMRILPWRWVSKKGWAGGDVTQMNNIGVHWNYQWEPTGLSTLNREWVPMIRGASQEKDFRWEEVRVRGDQTHFLGFNEPESVDQGNLTVEQAIALWPKAQQLGLRLGSPARTDGAVGNAWLSNFMTQADNLGYRVDYVCVHNYNEVDAAGLQSWLEAEYAKYQRPIWLTEFSRDADGTTTAAEQLAYITDVVAMLESLPFIERYAYYNFLGNNSGLFNGDNSTNARGDVYAGIVSNPGYRNTQPENWLTVELETGSNNNNVIVMGRGATISANLTPGSGENTTVEYFSDGISLGTASGPDYELSLDGAPAGLRNLTATATTSFGEQVSSASSQVVLSRLEMMPLRPDSSGRLQWSTFPGETYRVEFSDELSSASWNLLTTRTASGEMDAFTDPDFRVDSVRYYRVAWE